MGEIEGPKILKDPVLKCPFCSSLWEFQVQDSYAHLERVYFCNLCKRKFSVKEIL